MLGMDRAYVIKHKWHHEGLSIRQIAGDLEVSRNTVRKYLYGEGAPQLEQRPESLLRLQQHMLVGLRRSLASLEPRWQLTRHAGYFVRHRTLTASSSQDGTL